jgi:hypothetical protein
LIYLEIDFSLLGDSRLLGALLVSILGGMLLADFLGDFLGSLLWANLIGLLGRTTAHYDY